MNIKKGNWKQGITNSVTLKDWTMFEKIWLLVASTTILILSFLWDETAIGLIASLSGVLCVVLVAKGKLSSYFFGVINAATYGYVAMQYGLYGEMQLNWYFYLPLQFVGFALWYKHRKKTADNKVNGEDIYAKRLNRKQWGVLVVLIVIGYFGYSFYLNEIGSNLAGLDGLAVVLSVFAQFLMIFRFAEQWLLWIMINVLTVVLWFVVLLTSDGNDWTMLACWIAYLVNSVYGYINWINISKPKRYSYASELDNYNDTDGGSGV